MSTGSVNQTPGHIRPTQVREPKEADPSKLASGKVQIVGRYAPAAMDKDSRIATLAETLVYRPCTETNTNDWSALNRKALILPQRVAVAGMPELLSKESIDSLHLTRRRDKALKGHLEKLDTFLKHDSTVNFFVKPKVIQTRIMAELSAHIKDCTTALDAANITDHKKANLRARLADQLDVVETLQTILELSDKHITSDADLVNLALPELDENLAPPDSLYDTADYTKLSFKERTNHLSNMQKGLTEYKNKLSNLLTSETGRNLPAHERIKAKNLIAATSIRINAVAGLAHEEMRTHTTFRAELDSKVGKTLTRLCESELTRPDQNSESGVRKFPNPAAKIFTNHLELAVEAHGLRPASTNEQLVSQYLDILQSLNAEQAQAEFKQFQMVVGNSYPIIPETPVQEKDDAWEASNQIDSFRKNVDSIQEKFDSIPTAMNLNELVTARMFGYDVSETITAATVHLPMDVMAQVDFDEAFRQRGEEVPAGRGSINSVFKASWKRPDGTMETRVIKVDKQATAGLNNTRIMAVVGLGTNDGFGAVNRNLACGYVAQTLNMSDILPKPDAIVVDGKLAIAMPMAHGKTPKTTDLVSKKEILDDPKLSASLAKQLCRLEWLDCVTGQGDRHHNNYMVDVHNSDEKNKSVVVTAIDNDISFGCKNDGAGITHEDDTEKTPVNFNKFYIEEDRYPKFIWGPYQMRKLLHGPIGSGANYSGLYSGRLPSLIDSGTFAALIGNGSKTPQEILGKSVDLLSPEAYNAAVQRVRDCQNHAIQLKEMGLMVDNWETWESPQVQSPTSLSKYQTFEVLQGASPIQYLLTCGSDSYIARDFVDPVIMKDSAYAYSPVHLVAQTIRSTNE